MAQNIKLPNGALFPLKEGETPEQALAAARQMYPDAFAAPQPQGPVKESSRGTVGGAFKSGLEGLISSMQTGVGAATGSAEEAALAGLRRSQERAEKYGEATSLDRVKQAYEQDGVFSAAGEVLRQVPRALAEQAPNIAATLGAAKLGAMAGTAVAPGVGTLIGGGLGAFAPGALQMFGSNIERQAAEQQAQGKPIDIRTGAAAAAAAPQAALDVAATFIPLGRTVAGKILGPKVEQLLAKGAQESAEKLAQESFKATIGKGVLIGGAAEIPTEITQQMLERAQAGLSLTDADALKEYGETAYAVGLLAPIGGAGRFADKSAARKTVEAKKLADEAKARAAEVSQAEQSRQEQEAYQQTPEYLDDIEQRYTALKTRVEELQAAKRTKVEASDLAGKAAQREAGKALADLQKTDEYASTVQEYLQALPRIQARRQEQQLAAERTQAMQIPGAQADLFGGVPTVTDMSPLGQIEALNTRLAALAEQEKTATTPEQKQPLLTQRNAIEDQLRQLVPSQTEFDEARRRIEALQLRAQTEFAESTDTTTAVRASEAYERATKALIELDKFKPYITQEPKAPSLEALQKRLQKARDTGDVAAAAKILPQIQQLETQPRLFVEGAQQEEAFAQAIGDTREKLALARQKVEQEKAALGRIQEQNRLAPTLSGEFRNVLEQEREKEAKAAYDQALADYAKYQRLQDLQQLAAQLRGLPGSENALAKVQAEIDALRRPSMDQVAREARAARLETAVAGLQAKVATLPEGDARQAANTRLQKYQSELADLKAQNEAAERRRDTGEVGDNILTAASDERVSALLDKLLGTLESGPAPTSASAPTPAVSSVRAQIQKSQEQIADETAPLRKQIEELRNNPRKNKEQIAALEQQIAELELGGLQGNLFAPLIARPDVEGTLESQRVTTRSRMVELNERTADAFDKLYFEAEKRGQASPTVLMALRDQLERAAVMEIDFNLQASGAPAMSRAERNQLRQEINLLVDDMLRVGITRNPDNSYKLGEVSGQVFGVAPKATALTPEQLGQAQADLAATRNLRLSVLEPRLATLQEEIASLGRMAGKTGADLTSFVEQQMQAAGPQSLRNSIAAAQQKERELGAVLMSHITGNELELVTVPATVRGSDAPLSERALGNIKAALPVLEEQLAGIIRRFGTDMTLADTARGDTVTRIQSTPIENAAGMLERVRQVVADISTLNAYIQRAGTPKAGTPKFDSLKAVTEQRDALVREEQALRAAYNARAKQAQETLPVDSRPASTQEALVAMGATPQQLAALDMRIVELRRLRQEVVDARSRKGQVGTTKKEQALIDKYAKEGPALITQYDNELDRLLEMRKRMVPEESRQRDAYNEARRAEQEGRISDTSRAEMQQELAAINRQLQNLTVTSASGNIRQQLESAKADLEARLAAPETEATPAPTTQRALPGVASGAVTLVKPVSEERITQARTEMVEARTRVETIKSAMQRVGTEPQYFREVAQRLRNEADTFYAEMEREGAVLLQRLEGTYRQKLLEATYFDALAESADGAQARASIETALETANNDLERATATYEALTERQRRYEAQEDVRTGAAPGERAARRLQAGQGAGFVSISGRQISAPREATSWDIQKDSRTKAPKPTAVAAAGNIIQSVKNVLARMETGLIAGRTSEKETQAQIAALTEQRAKLDTAITTSFSDSMLADVGQELENIDARAGGVSKERTDTLLAEYKRVQGNPAATAALFKNVENEVDYARRELAAATRALTAAKEKVDAAYTRQQNADISKPGVYSGMLSVVAQAETAYDNAKMAAAEAETAYLTARRAQLRLIQAEGQALRNAQLGVVQALADKTSQLSQVQTTLAATTKDRDALQKRVDKAQEAADKERSAVGALAEKERQERTQALDAAAAAREALSRAQQGLGLPGTRVSRDTAAAIPTAVQNDIKRRIAEAETNLGKLTANDRSTVEEIRAATQNVQALKQELDTIYGMVQPTVEAIAPQGRTALEQRIAEAKERLEDLEFDGAPTAEIEAARTRVRALEKMAAGPAPAEGMRLPERKVGPLVRNVSGSKKLIQGGMQRLRASGLSQEAANSITIAHYTVQLEGNPNSKTAKAKLDAATKGMTQDQIDAAFEEGVRLIGSGPTLEVIAKREALRQATVAYAKAEKDLADARAAKDADMVVVAQDGLAIADNNRTRALDAYNLAKELYEAQFIKPTRTAKAQAELEAELDAAFEATSIPNEADTVTPERSRIDRRSGKVVFRTATTAGPGTPVAQLEKLVAQITGLWKNVPKISIAANFSALPERIRQQAIADGVQDTFPGVYDPETDTAYLVADRLHTKEDVAATLAHEIAGHFGLRSIMGDDYTRIMNMLYNGNRALRQKADAKLADNPQLGVEVAVEEVLADMAEQEPTPQTQGVLGRVIAFIKTALKRLTGQTVSDAYIRQIVANARQYVVEGGPAGPGGRYTGGPVFRSKNTPQSAMVGQRAGTWDTLRGNLFGLPGRVQLVDRLGAVDEAFVRAQNAGVLSSLEAETAQYFMRLGDMTTQAAGQFITSGPVKIVSEKIGTKSEERYQSQVGATLTRVAEHIDAAAKAGLGDSAEIAVTAIIAGNRANSLTNGWERLNAENPAAAKAEYEMYKAKLAANPAAKAAVDAAIAEYQQYNNGLLDFLVETGFMAKHEADRLKKVPYVPFYRIDNGAVSLFTGEEKPIRIGNLADNPDLKQLLGDSRHIMPLLTSAVQNTFMLTRAGLRNKATHTTADALYKAGFATKFGKGPGIDSASTVRFKVGGEDYFATIDADTFGVPATLIVQGMEGIKTTPHALVKMLGIPANVLRKFVTRSPAYVIRQLIRDPVNAAIVGGVDGVPVLNALREMASMRGGRSPNENALMRGLVVSSNVYTGDERDMQKFLEDISTGGGKWDKLVGLLDTAALKADAATRAIAYQDALNKGFTQRQAEYRALEVQNFSRRGLSPSMQALSVMVPFFNAQIQGLDVLYRSFRGKMPFSERLEIQRKIYARGALLMAGTLAYALMMQDDEEYMKIPPEQRYANFFVPIPGVKEPLKVPIPYEVGLLFKALPEAVVDAALNDTKASEAIKGISMLLWQSTPGVVPLAAKPIAEALYGQTMVGPIESAREKSLEVSERYREGTPEVLKLLGGLTGVVGVSPLMLEHFVRGYTSGLGLSLLSVLNPVLADPTLEKATPSTSKLPFIGGLFQTTDGRFAIDRAYAQMEEINRVRQTYKDYVATGRVAEAEAYREQYLDMLAAGSAAGAFQRRMGLLFTEERITRASRLLSTEEKDARIAQIKAAQNELAARFSEVTERTTRP